MPEMLRIRFGQCNGKGGGREEIIRNLSSNILFFITRRGGAVIASPLAFLYLRSPVNRRALAEK